MSERNEAEGRDRYGLEYFEPLPNAHGFVVYGTLWLEGPSYSWWIIPGTIVDEVTP